MKTKIYALVHPITKEVVYVGQTTKSLSERLKGHYWKLNEANNRKINPNLLNEANGGIGGNTISNKTDEEKKAIGNKISNILSGKSKPDGFAEHLSDIRTGKGNPMAKVLNPKIVVLKSTNNNSIIRSFDYVFEINAFLDDAHAGSNIVKQLKKRPYTRSKGYVFRYIQDIDNEKLNN